MNIKHFQSQNLCCHNEKVWSCMRRTSETVSSRPRARIKVGTAGWTGLVGRGHPNLKAHAQKEGEGRKRWGKEVKSEMNDTILGPIHMMEVAGYSSFSLLPIQFLNNVKANNQAISQVSSSDHVSRSPSRGLYPHRRAQG